MTEHSPEAIAAYPYKHHVNADVRAVTNSWVDDLRTAFDAGRAVTFAATREALIDTLLTGGTDIDQYILRSLSHYGADKLADAILAPGGPIRDVREVKAEAWDEGYIAVPADPEDREQFIEDAPNPYRGEHG